MVISKKARQGKAAATSKSKVKKPARGTNGKAVPTRPVRIRSQEDVDVDWWWILLDTTVEQRRPYFGKHVAVVDKKIVASAVRSSPLRENVAKQLHLDPESVVIHFVG
jgi:hypothetical protein